MKPTLTVSQSTTAPRKVRDYRPETLSLLSALVAADFTLGSYDNGDERMAVPATLSELAEELCGADEARLYVRHASVPGKVLGILLVLGNSPGELCADYADRPALDAVCMAESEKWTGQEQPMTEGT